MEMIGLMHEAEPYGHLVLAGRAMDYKTLSRVIGVDEGDVKRAVKELESRAVFSRTDSGVIFSRRMIRDEKRRETLQENGRQGGNPRLKKQGVGGGLVKQEPNQEDKPQIPEARKSSEANASGCADPVKQVFDLGVAILTSNGTAERQARSLIGKWCKSKGEAEVLQALLDARSKASPLEWIEARLRSAKWVSASGYEYRGTDEQVMREAERRHDMTTYWAVKAKLARAA
jgi:hypothetical protein